MTRSDEWSAPWAAKKLKDHECVTQVDQVGTHGLIIHRRNRTPLEIAVIGVERVDAGCIDDALILAPDSAFVLNVGSGGYVPAGGYERATELGLGVGALGELLSVIYQADVSEPVGSKATFVLRSVDQHSNVSKVSRVADVLYSIERKTGDSLVAAMLYEYELGADAVRTAMARYPEATVLVSANPNATTSQMAIEAAESAGIKLLSTWKAFYRDLRN